MLTVPSARLIAIGIFAIVLCATAAANAACGWAQGADPPSGSVTTQPPAQQFSATDRHGGAGTIYMRIEIDALAANEL